MRDHRPGRNAPAGSQHEGKPLVPPRDEGLSPLCEVRELAWVGGCVTAPATWASPPGRQRRSVHRSVEMASRCYFGAFVYTVATWAWVVSGLGIAIVYTNGRIGPLRAGLGHLCTLLGCGAVADRRGNAGVYTDWLKRPLRVVLGRLCTLLGCGLGLWVALGSQ